MKGTTDKSSEIFQEELYQIPTMFQASVESSDHRKSCEKYYTWKSERLISFTKNVQFASQINVSWFKGFSI